MGNGDHQMTNAAHFRGMRVARIRAFNQFGARAHLLHGPVTSESACQVLCI